MGAIRLFLALVVAVGHLQAIVLAPANLVVPGMNAGFAVIFFYVISGFLISLALSQKYAPTVSGTVEFYKNRFIRIFSLYWPMVVVVFIALPPVRAWFLADSIPDKFTNLFILGMDWRISFARYPDFHWDAAVFSLRQAWTLGAELTFYILAPFLLRSWALTWIALIVSAVTRIAIVSAIGFDEHWTYLFLPSTFLFFLIGHLAQSASSRWPLINRPAVGFLFLVGTVSALIVPHFARWDSPRFWIAVLCFAAAIPGIFQRTKRIAFLNTLGELSYPVYLTHLFIIVMLTNNGFLQGLANTIGSGPEVAAIFVALTIGAAIVAHWVLEKPTAIIMLSLIDGVLLARRRLVLKYVSYFR